MSLRIAAFLLLAVASAALAPGAEARKSILLVYDEDENLPGLAMIDDSLRETFKKGLNRDVEFFSESLQLSQFPDAGYDRTLRDHFRRKYAERQPDLIVAVMEPSLDFVLRHRDELFPGVPIVYCGPDSSEVEGKALPPDIVGVTVTRTFAPTLEVALRLQPHTRNVFVIGGTTRFDRHLQAIARREFASFADKVKVTYLTSQTMDQLLETVARLPEHSVVIYLTLFADSAGRAFIPHEALAQIAAESSAPVYVSVDQYVGLGSVGGYVYSLATHGHRAAALGLGVLGVDAMPSTAPDRQGDFTYMFDGRQLKRWHLDEKRLPRGSMVSFRSPSVWELYKWYVVAGAALVLLQAALIAGLLVNRTQRQRADRNAVAAEARRRQAEEEVRRQRDELAHALRLTTLGELAASFAHELGQPLTAILANAQASRHLLLAQRDTTKDVDEALVDIAADANRAAETIRRLRSLSRREHFETTPLEIDELIEDVLALIRTDLRDKDITVYFARGDELPLVNGDPVQLRQVALNLIVNAAEAITMADGGPRMIQIETRCTDDTHIECAVRDSGIGVSTEDELQRMFHYFVTTKPHGLGMGLAISRAIVEAHKGRIWATRNPDRGLTLHVELPIQRESGPAHA